LVLAFTGYILHLLLQSPRTGAQHRLLIYSCLVSLTAGMVTGQRIEEFPLSLYLFSFWC